MGIPPPFQIPLTGAVAHRPRLGALLNRVVGVGLTYLLFSVIEGVLRVKSVSLWGGHLLLEGGVLGGAAHGRGRG